MTVGVLIVASGNGSRFLFGNRPKQYLRLQKKAILLSAIERFLSLNISFIRVVIGEHHVQYYNAEVTEKVNDKRLLPFIFGGDKRQKSVYEGLKSLMGSPPEFIIVHDGCRPFFSDDVFYELLSEIKSGSCSGVIPVISISESVCMTTKSSFVCSYSSRDALKIVQTPQVFVYEDLLKCHVCACECMEDNFTDDGSMLLKNGMLLKTVTGDSENLKITIVRDALIMKGMNVL